MERDRIVIPCHLMFLRVCASGPLLISVYSSKLFKIIKLYLPNAHAFADDTQLYLSFNPGNSLSEAEAVHTLEQCIRAIRVWMQADKLKVNDNKQPRYSDCWCY